MQSDDTYGKIQQILPGRSQFWFHVLETIHGNILKHEHGRSTVYSAKPACPASGGSTISLPRFNYSNVSSRPIRPYTATSAWRFNLSLLRRTNRSIALFLFNLSDLHASQKSLASGKGSSTRNCWRSPTTLTARDSTSRTTPACAIVCL